jgi:hypothetical protein
MTIADDDEIRAVIHAVNQGIDAHLEACNCLGRGDRYEPEDVTVEGRLLARKLSCTVSVESFPVLLRRLWETESEAAENLLTSILDVLGFEDVGTDVFEIISPVDEPMAIT